MGNKKGGTWYGVFAANGFGVYSNYGKILADRKFMRSMRLKSFDTRQEAEEFASDGILSLNGADCISDMLSETFNVNYFYFLKSDKKNNMEETSYGKSK